MAPDSQTFPFLKLPREIRDHVYSILLCSFEAFPQDVQNSIEKPIDRSRREIDVSILRTSKQVYHEAYQLMVLKNKFVHVKSAITRYSLVDFLCSVVAPVVTVNSSHADQFIGASLKVIIYMADKEDVRMKSKSSQSVLLLGRDDKSMKALCELLSGYNANFPHLFPGQKFVATFIFGRRITKNPVISEDFFSDGHQKLLLQPFRSRLRGKKCVKFIGISEDVMQVTKKDITAEDEVSAEQLLNEIITAKKEGGLRFKKGEHQSASVRWREAITKVARARMNETQWERLVSQGGPSFTSSLAELTYLMQLNLAHIHLLRMEAIERGSLAWEKEQHLAGEALEKATNIEPDEPPASDFKWNPPPLTRAKLRYRTALHIRLSDDPEDVHEAMDLIKWAADLAPNDVAIAKEAKRIQEWSARVHEEEHMQRAMSSLLS